MVTPDNTAEIISVKIKALASPITQIAEAPFKKRVQAFHDTAATLPRKGAVSLLRSARKAEAQMLRDAGLGNRAQRREAARRLYAGAAC